MSASHAAFVRFTVAQAADAANRNAHTVRKALEDGTLHGVQRKKGGRWTVRPECIDAWLAGESCPHGEGKAA